MDSKRARCPKGTRKFKALGDGCYTDEEIENHKKTKTRKNKEGSPIIKKKKEIVVVANELIPVAKELIPVANEIEEKKQEVSEEPDTGVVHNLA